MVTSGGFGGGPSLPMMGEFGPFTAVLALVVILVAIYLVTRFVDV
jgi:flagellar biogenesis protein FliO